MDYRSLSRHILGINQGHDLNEILKETSRCLKEILDYRIFAFAVQEEGQLDLWIDPALYSGALRKTITRDFDYSGACRTHAIANAPAGDSPVIAFQEDNILSFILPADHCHARLYLLPNGKMSSHHTDIIDIIVRSLGIALKNHMDIKRLKNDAAFDPLTNCYNRREFNRLLEHNIAQAHRHNKPMSLIMIDIDHFKRVNDTYGHPAGDKVLKTLVNIVRHRIRKGDYLARFGGEEFVVVLPETRMNSAIELAEQLRQRIAAERIPVEEETVLSITASLGVSSISSRSSSPQHLLKKADEMLYKAKIGGRDKVMPPYKQRTRKTAAKDKGAVIAFDHLAHAGS